MSFGAGRVVRAIRRRLRRLGIMLMPWGMEARFRRAVRSWFAADGDGTLRLDYTLSHESVVVDAGGYKGDWSAAIVDRYNPNLHILEPVGAFCECLRQRFATNNAASVHEAALLDHNGEITLFLADDATSSFETASARLVSDTGHDTRDLIPSTWERL